MENIRFPFKLAIKFKSRLNFFVSYKYSSRKKPIADRLMEKMIEKVNEDDKNIEVESNPKDEIEDYTISKTKIRFKKTLNSNTLDSISESETGLKMNTNSELNLIDNPIAMKILSEQNIDLLDEEISVKSMSIHNSQLLDEKFRDQLKEIALGNVVVQTNNSVHLILKVDFIRGSGCIQCSC